MNHFGYYGKTIHRGDFVRYNLPQAFVSVWDDWLLQLMIKGEEKHAEQWSTLYQNSPTYRFALSPGIAGEDAWLGVAFASTDKVGRRFPFCFACALPEDMALISGDQTGDSFIEPWYVAIEQFGREIQNEDFNFDSLQAQMAEFQESFVARREFTQYTKFTPGPSDGKGQLAIVGDMSTLTHTRTGIVNLLHASLKQTSFHYSQWISIGSSDHGKTIIVEGLPTGNLGLALFDQQWVESGAGIMDTSVMQKQNQSVGGPSDTYIPAPTATAESETVVNEPATYPENDNTDLEQSNISEQSESVSASEDSIPTAEELETKVSALFPESEELSVNPTVEKLEIEEDTSSDDPWN